MITSTRRSGAEEGRRGTPQGQGADRAAFPSTPKKTCCCSLIQHAPLKNWQRDILEIVRDEAYYFAPQGQTKVCNEGWACIHKWLTCLYK